MRYTGHKSINGVPILEDGKYIAIIYNDDQNTARIFNDDGTKLTLDRTTYSDAAGKITYQTSAFRVKIKTGRVRRI